MEYILQPLTWDPSTAAATAAAAALPAPVTCLTNDQNCFEWVTSQITPFKPKALCFMLSLIDSEQECLDHCVLFSYFAVCIYSVGLSLDAKLLAG